MSLAPPLQNYPAPTLLGNLTDYGDNVALLTRCGHKGQGDSANQDRIILFQHGASQMIALFDGHGARGHVVSHAAALAITKAWMGGSVKPSFLTNAFLQMDKTLPQVYGSGATAIIMIHQEDELLVANLGDSQAFVAQFDPIARVTNIIYLTKQHKPHMPEERARIETAGGRVMLPQSPGDTSRVIIPIGTIELGLAMSRSLGDHEAKRMGVIAEPTVDVVNLTDKQLLFAVAATDGIFDFIPIQDVADHLGRALYSGRKTVRLMDACEQLIMKASMQWKERSGSTYRDDISILVTKL